MTKEEAKKEEDIVTGLGKAAESAFEKLFGTKKEDDEKDAKEKTNAKDSESKAEEEEEDVKQRAAS